MGTIGSVFVGRTVGAWKWQLCPVWGRGW